MGKKRIYSAQLCDQWKTGVLDECNIYKTHNITRNPILIHMTVPYTGR